MANDLEELLNLIKEIGPNFQVTKSNLQNPTSDFVTKFYTNFVTEFQDKIQFLAGPFYYTTESNDSLEPEDRLFQTVYQILYSFEKFLIFKLSDIYCPSSVRTKKFIQLCCHLLAFAENTLDDLDNIGNKIFSMKTNINCLKKEQEEMLLVIQQNAIRKGELLEKKEKLLEEHAQLRNLNYEKTEFAVQKEKVCSKKRRETEILTQQLQKEEIDLQSLEKEEQELSEQCVTEEEYTNLLKLKETLENDQKTLDIDGADLGEFLHEEHNEVLHFQECIKIIPDVIDFNLETVKHIIDLEDELRDLQIKYDKLVNNKTNPLKLLQSQNEKKLIEAKEHLTKVSARHEMMKNNYLDYKNDCVSKVKKFREDKKNTLDFNNNLITNLCYEIVELQTKLNQLKTTFCTEYTKVAEADATAKEYFKEIINKILNLP